MRKRVWITGSEGFIGGHVASMCEAVEFFDVTRIDRKHGREIEHNVLKDLALPEVVIHCAGNASVSKSVENPAEDYRDNVLATKTLLTFLDGYAPHCHVIGMSSVAVYGDRKYYSEDAIPAPISPYGRHKVEVENLLRMSGLFTTIIRSASAYGPGQYKQLPYDFAKKLMKGKGPVQLAGDGEETRDFVFVQDLAGALIAIAKGQRCPKVMNFGTGISTSVKEFTNHLARALGYSVNIEFTGERRAGDPKHSRVATRNMIDFGFFAPTPLWVGLNMYARWVRHALQETA